MNRNLLRMWLAGLGVAAFSSVLLSCSSPRDEEITCSSPRDEEITPEEAKAMILRYISTEEASGGHRWIIASRPLVEKDRPSRLRTGSIAVGPWMVDVEKQTVQLAIDRAQLDGSFRKEGDRYVIIKTEVLSIRGPRIERVLHPTGVPNTVEE